MALAPGTRIGVYEITALFGEGGMGQVYRATDTRLKRQVALKILPPTLAADVDRLSRFQCEAEVLASLNHPHIAGIYGLEEGSGVSAIIAAHLELGRTIPALAGRRQGTVLPVARQPADGRVRHREQRARRGGSRAAALRDARARRLARDFYDVASDGQRFMVVVPDETTSTPLTLVTNWPAIVNNRR